MDKMIVLILVLVCSGPVFAENYPELYESVDTRLQLGLEQTLNKLGLAAAADAGKLSVALVDITDPHQPRAAFINGDNMVYAASLPKIAILLGVLNRVEKGELELDNRLREKLTQMIRFSSNSAASEMLDVAGNQKLSELLQSPRFRLYDAERNGGLWVGKAYGKGTAFLRDPLHQLSHGASALQVARFYYLLETNRLVAPQLKSTMKEILSAPGIAHKFVEGLSQKAGKIELYRKSGTWKDWHADSALVERDQHRYIAVALAESPKGGEWLRRLIDAMDDLVMHSPPSPAATPVRVMARHKTADKPASALVPALQ